MPHYTVCFAPDKKIISKTFRIRGTLVFLCPKEREIEREREQEKSESESKSERESESESESESETGTRKGTGKGKEIRRKARAIIFLNRPGHSEKSANYTIHT
jgi:hypothetical protein